jgi:hypothetical protein
MQSDPLMVTPRDTRKQRCIPHWLTPGSCKRIGATVWRRTRILSGLRSSRSCTVSRTACSHRDIRRFLPGMH